MANSFYFIQEPDQNGMYIVDGSETVFYIAEDDASAVYLVEGDGVPYNQFKALQDQVNGIIISNGATRFTALTDAPSSYAGQAGKSVIVNGTETGVTFQTIVAGDPQLRSDVMSVSAFLQSEIVSISSQAGNATISLVAGTSGVLQAEINTIQAFDAQVAGITGSFATVSALNMESAARAAADALLAPLTTVAGISAALAAADSSEASTRAAADSALSAAVATASGNLAGDIAGEAAARSAADALLTPLATTAAVSAGLDARITTNTNAISNIQTWDSQLASITGSFALNSLVSSVSAGLSGAINSEAGIRTAADANLQSQIDALTTSDISRSEVAAISAGLDSRITTNTTAISNIQTFDSQLAAVTGSFATVSYVGTVSGSLSAAIAGEASQRAAADLLLTPITTTAAISAGLDSRITTLEGATDDDSAYALTADVANLTAGLDSRITTLEGNPVPDIFRAEVANLTGQIESDISVESVFRANADASLQGQLNLIGQGTICNTHLQIYPIISNMTNNEHASWIWSAVGDYFSGKIIISTVDTDVSAGYGTNTAAEYIVSFNHPTSGSSLFKCHQYVKNTDSQMDGQIWYDATNHAFAIALYNQGATFFRNIKASITLIGYFSNYTTSGLFLDPTGTRIDYNSPYIVGSSTYNGVGYFTNGLSISGSPVATETQVRNVTGSLQSQITNIQTFDTQVGNLTGGWALTTTVAGLTGSLQGQINTNTSNISNIQTFDSQVAGLTGSTWVALAGSQTKTGTLTLSGGSGTALILETDNAGPWNTILRRTDLGSNYDVSVYNDGTIGGGLYARCRSFTLNDGVHSFVQATSGGLVGTSGFTFGNGKLTANSAGCITSTDDANVNGSNFIVNTSTKTSALYGYEVQRSGVTVGGLAIDGSVLANAVTVSAGNAAANITLDGSGNLGARTVFNAGSGSVLNWMIGHNWITAGALEFIPSSSNGGSTYVSPVLKLASDSTAIFQEPGTGSGVGGVITSTISGGGNAGYRYRTLGTDRWSTSLIGAVGSEALRIRNESANNEVMRFNYDGSAVHTGAVNISGATTIAGTTIVNNSSTATPFKMTGDRNGSLAIRAENVSVSGSASTGFVAANAATSTSLLLNGSGQATDPNALIISQLGANPIIVQQNGAETFRHTGAGNLIATGSMNLSGALNVNGNILTSGSENISGSLYVTGSIYQNGNLVTGGTGNILSQITSTVNITAATTLDASSFGKLYIVTTGVTGVSAGNYTVNLPSVSGNAGKIIGISIDSGAQNVFTFQASGSEMIDGASQRIMWAGESAFLESNGTNWHKVAGTSLPMNCYLWKDSAQSTSSGVRAAITFNNCKYANPPYMNDVLHYQIICPRPGTYVAESCWTNSSGTNPQHAIFKNDITVASNQIGYAAGLSSLTPVCCLQLAKGDTILSAETITSAGAIYVESTHDYICFMRVCEIPTW